MKQKERISLVYTSFYLRLLCVFILILIFRDRKWVDDQRYKNGVMFEWNIKKIWVMQT